MVSFLQFHVLVWEYSYFSQPTYAAPEILVQVMKQTILASVKADIWSLGIVLLEIITGKLLFEGLSVTAAITKILGYCQDSSRSFFDVFIEAERINIHESIPAGLVDLIQICLKVKPSERPTIDQCFKHEFFKDATSKTPKEVVDIRKLSPFTDFSRSTKFPKLLSQDSGTTADDIKISDELDLKQLFHLWRLTGGDLKALLRKAGLFQPRPPILTLPNLCVEEEGVYFGQVRDKSTLYNDQVVVLPMQALYDKLNSIDKSTCFPILFDKMKSVQREKRNTSAFISDTSSLPLLIKEKDIVYQVQRMLLFDRLLIGYPYTRPLIWHESRTDIPPFERPNVWAALLEVQGDIQSEYNAVDKITPIPIDRQIEVDVPRCHQYSDLLSSPEAHLKLKRILKTWVLTHPHYVYWQGLDSLTAPFLYLHFSNEALAFACLKRFTNKYLNGFFLRDNSLVIEEYLTVFSHLNAFHDPLLFMHMDDIEFIPDLFAIPWFLTMFAHVFPIHNILHLWDTLLLGNTSFPICIGVAILMQLRHRLMETGFNESILLFSDMPEIDLERVVRDSIRIFCATPRSALFRRYGNDWEGEEADPNDVFAGFSVKERKDEKCARILCDDLIELSEINKPTKHGVGGDGRVKIVVIDIRPTTAYEKGTFLGSISVPYDDSPFLPDGSLSNPEVIGFLNKHRPQVKVLLSDMYGVASEFAGRLMRLGYSKVCILHDGVQQLRQKGLLIVQH